MGVCGGDVKFICGLGPYSLGAPPDVCNLPSKTLALGGIRLDAFQSWN